MASLKKIKKIFMIFLIGGLVAVGSISCAVRNIIDSRPVPEILEKEKLPHKVAILPFANSTATPRGGETVRKMFYNFFSSLNYIDLELTAIDDTLKGADLYQKIIAREAISTQNLGQLLGVDAVVFGEVTSLGKIFALVYSDNQAGLKARMVNCASGKVIWELEHDIHIEDGDLPLSLIGLAATFLKTVVTHSQATHMKAASELCMQAVSTIPNPPDISGPPPVISALVHNGAGKLLRPGEYLKVALIGEAGQTATWSVPPLVENLPMKEKKPGVYLGAYRIRPKDRLTDGRLIGFLVSDMGSGSQWVDTLGALKIGEPTILPAVIAKDTTLEQEKSPYLVKDAIVVLAGATLTVQPGTVIWFGSLGLIIRGNIQILGTREKPVRLASLGSSNWKGLIFDHSKTANHLAHCEILNAEYGIRASKSQISVQNCLLQDNVWGIVIENGTAEINASLIRTSKKTAIAVRQSRLVVTESLITENNSGGFLLDNSRVKIVQNNILNNGGWGIKALSNQDEVQAGNNWWGKMEPDPNDTIGPVDIKPMLKAPVDFAVLD
jgi:hypothetical protein